MTEPVSDGSGRATSTPWPATSSTNASSASMASRLRSLAGVKRRKQVSPARRKRKTWLALLRTYRRSAPSQRATASETISGSASLSRTSTTARITRTSIIGHVSLLLLFPCSAQDTLPVLVRDLAQRRVVKASFAERANELRQARHVLQV